MKAKAKGKIGMVVMMALALGCGAGYRIPTMTQPGIQAGIEVDASKSAGMLDHSWEVMTGSGHAGLYLREGWDDKILAQLKDAHDNLGIPMVRFHGIFGDGVGVYKGPGQYDFSGVDRIYDGILSTGVKPFLELSFMPEALASKDSHGFPAGYRPNISPPRDYEEWGKMIGAFTKHLVERYGLAEVKGWYFEVWNEPNLGPPAFWAGNMEDYFRLYDVTARAIKAVSPELKVGGPASSQSAWIFEFLEHCKQAQVPVDFVSTHGYYNETLVLLKPQAKKAGVDADRDLTGRFFHDAFLLVNRIAAKAYPSALPLFITEWNSSVAYSYDMNLWPNDHDLPNDAAFMAKAAKEVNGLTAGFSHWTHSDVFEEWGLPGTQWPVRDGAFHGGFGLITIDGIHKPSYHAFAFLHRMGKNLIQTEAVAAGKGLDAMATLDHDRLAVMVWYYLDTVKKRETAAPEARVMLELKGLPPALIGKSLYGYRIDAEHGNAFPEWIKMGKPAKLNADQVERLRKLSDDTLRAPELDRKLEAASLSLEFSLPPAAVVFLATP